MQNVIYDVNAIRSVKDVVKRLEKLSRIDETEQQQENQLVVAEKASELNIEDKCDIMFKDVSLYLGENRLIDHFSFKFETGKKYLMVGLNGAGKSSVFKTLKKWYGSFPGTIFVNETDIGDIDNNSLSHIVSYMNENVCFFSGSVRDNITLFRECNDGFLNQAVADAQVRLDLDREIKGDGTNISSGEQRRIEIARSLLSSVKVLIFDEVVSTLDIETAYEIEKLALEFKDKTVIFISHNFSGKLMQEYDEILVMDNGALMAHGPYEELLDKCEYFRKICEIKFGQI